MRFLRFIKWSVVAAILAICNGCIAPSQSVGNTHGALLPNLPSSQYFEPLEPGFVDAADVFIRVVKYPPIAHIQAFEDIYGFAWQPQNSIAISGNYSSNDNFYRTIYSTGNNSQRERACLTTSFCEHPLLNQIKNIYSRPHHRYQGVLISAWSSTMQDVFVITTVFNNGSDYIYGIFDISGEINAAVIATNGGRTCWSGNCITIFDFEQNQAVRHPPGCSPGNCDFPDNKNFEGQFAWSDSYPIVAYLHPQKTVQFANLGLYSLRSEVTSNLAQIPIQRQMDVSWTPNQDAVVVLASNLDTSSINFYMYQVEDLTLLAEITLPKTSETLPKVYVSPNLQMIALQENGLIIYDITSSEVLLEINEPVMGMQWSREGNLIAFATETELVVLSNTFQKIHQETILTRSIINPDEVLAWSSNGAFLAVNTGDKVIVWESNSWHSVNVCDPCRNVLQLDWATNLTQLGVLNLDQTPVETVNNEYRWPTVTAKVFIYDIDLINIGSQVEPELPALGGSQP